LVSAFRSCHAAILDRENAFQHVRARRRAPIQTWRDRPFRGWHRAEVVLREAAFVVHVLADNCAIVVEHRIGNISTALYTRLMTIGFCVSLRKLSLRERASFVSSASTISLFAA
jgi:hypothetical protein